MELLDIIQAFGQDRFISFVLLVFLIVYGFFAVVLSIQINSYNRILTQYGFATVFSIVGYINVIISIALIIITLLTL